METYRLTLSCTICHTRKSCLGDGKKRFRVAFAASFWVILSNLDCKTVKVTLQNSQSETARLTWWRANIDYLGTVLHGFLQEEETGRLQEIVYPAEYQEYTENVNKHQKTGLKLAVDVGEDLTTVFLCQESIIHASVRAAADTILSLLPKYHWSLQPGFRSCRYSRCRPSDADNGV